MNRPTAKTSLFKGEFAAPWIFFVLAAVSIFFAFGAMFESATSNTLIGGPEFVVDFDDADGVITRLTPTILENSALRFGWGAASALILVGVAVFLLTVGQVGRRVPGVPLFSPEIRSLLTKRWLLAMTLFIVGGVSRSILRLAISNELSLEDEFVGTGEGSDFDLWIFEVPTLLLIGLALTVGWIFNQGADVQAASEDIV